jgi:hypothetical protein
LTVNLRGEDGGWSEKGKVPFSPTTASMLRWLIYYMDTITKYLAAVVTLGGMDFYLFPQLYTAKD